MTRSRRLPDFLIIGAMKAGTTSMYRDLLAHPQVFMPIDKEPEALCRDNVLTPEGERTYERLFRNASPEQICGEASTGYTKLPDIARVPERAKRVLNKDVRIIYLVREPIARIVSHHHHDYGAGDVGADINAAVREHPRFVNYSRYAMQIRPWFDTFGMDAIRIVVFEEYISHRTETIAELSSFLGIDPKPVLIRKDEVYNRSDGKVVARGPMKRVIESGVYRRFIRPFLPIELKDRLRQRLLPRAPARPDPPNAETVRFLADELAPEVESLGGMLGRRDPIWNLQAVSERFADRGDRQDADSRQAKEPAHR